MPEHRSPHRMRQIYALHWKLNDELNAVRAAFPWNAGDEEMLARLRDRANRVRAIQRRLIPIIGDIGSELRSSSYAMAELR